ALARSMKAVVVASGLVSEERSKIVSGRIGVRAGSRLRQPKAAWWRTRPAWETRITAPGNAPAATAPSISSPTRAKSTSGDRRLERDEAPALGIERDLDAEGERHVLRDPSARGVPRGEPERDRAGQVAHARAHDVERAHAVDRRACRHGAEDDARDALELARLAKVREQAVEAVGPLGHVLEEEDRPVGVGGPGRAERRRQHREAAADEPPAGRAGPDRDRRLRLPAPPGVGEQRAEVRGG